MTIALDLTAGDDRYTADTDTDYTLAFRAGHDWLRVTAGNVRATMGYGDDVVRIESGSSTVYSQGGNDRFNLLGGLLNADGGDGADRFVLFGGMGVMKGGGGNDRFDIRADAVDAQLIGGLGNDSFFAYGHDFEGAVRGEDGNDRFLDFGAGATLIGGTGNDVYRIDTRNPAAIVEEVGEGRDTVQITGGGDFTLFWNFENLVVIGGVAGNGEDRTTLSGNDLANRIVGGIDDEYLVGNEGNDFLLGGGGSDVIEGGSGNDRIAGGAGHDFMYGGLGVDTFVFWTDDAPPKPSTGFNDTIEYWEYTDLIDVSAIDANTELAGQQHFTLVSGQGSAIGTLYFWQDTQGTFQVVGHTDADGLADFVVTIGGGWDIPVVTADNFIT